MSLFTIDRCHHKSDLRRICSTSKVGIYLFCVVLVQGDESIKDVIACSSVIRCTYKLEKFSQSFRPRQVISWKESKH